MRIADVNGRTRAEVAQRLLGTRDSALARALGERFQLRYYGFSSRADPIPDGRALKFAGGRTTSVRHSTARARISTVPLAGVVVISDGADNSATALAEPLLALNARGLPVYTIGVGAPRFDRDIEITRVELYTPLSAARHSSRMSS